MAKLGKYLQKKWESKVKLVQWVRRMNRQNFSLEDTFLCLSGEELNGEIESEIIAAQYQALQNQISCD